MIHFDEGAQADLRRILEANRERDPASALAHVETIQDAVDILARHPEIGRLVEGSPGMRELVVSHVGRGYIALYEYSPLEGLVRIAAIRQQREAGYPER